ncbi:MAG: diacylglycerol kinase family protein [Cyanobacteria bacterium J06592_8]
MNVNESSLSPLQARLVSVPNPHRPSKSKPEPSSSSTHNPSDSSWTVASNLFVSFQYAWTGVAYAYKTQRNFRIHTIIGTLAISLGIVLHLSAVKLAVIGLTIGAVMAMELLNTAIESVVDLTVGQSYHELAKIAKDCAAGAVLIFAIAALLVAIVLLLPPLFVQLGLLAGV